jgi:ParB-like chromosome segregation protein Spo0J
MEGMMATSDDETLAPAPPADVRTQEAAQAAGPQDAGEPGDALPEPVWSSGLPADLIGPVEWRPVVGLKPYTPRFIEVPSFRGTPGWAMLRQLLRESGVRDPLLILPDGRVIDGVHRLELARALGLAEVPTRVVRLPERLSEAERLQLETTRATLNAGRRRLGPPELRSLLLQLTQAEAQLDVMNDRTANLRRGRLPGPGPAVPTQRERAQAVGLSERTVRQLDRIVREAPPDVVAAVRDGTLSAKAAERRLGPAAESQLPTGTVRARENPADRPASEAGVGGHVSPAGTQEIDAAPRLSGTPGNHEPPAPAAASLSPVEDTAVPVARAATPRTSTGTGPGDAPESARSRLPPAVEAFMALCRELEAATRQFRQETAHWTGERRRQRDLTIWQGIQQLEEQLEWMESTHDACGSPR